MTMNLFEAAAEVPQTAAESTTKPTIYRIAEHKFDGFKASIERLKRRASKLGCGEIGFTTHGIEVDKGYHVHGRGQYPRLVFLPDGQTPFTAYATSDYTSASCSRRMHLVSVTGDSPKLNGWAFVAALDPMCDEDGKSTGNLVRSIPGMEVPEEFLTAEISCSHCRLRRNRNSTYVVRHDDGSYKQIGRQCLKDFTGHSSPESVATYAEILIDLRRVLEDVDDEYFEQEESISARRTHFYKVTDLLEMATCLIRINGWKPSYYDMSSTKEQLIHWRLSSGAELARIEENYKITETDKENASLTLEWMAALQNSHSEYEFNLYLLSKAGRVKVETFGFLASAVPAFMRQSDRIMAAKRAYGASEYVGEAGKRSEMTLTLVSTAPFETAYGTQTLCKFTDDQGNAIVWWASKAPDFAVGARIKAKATVKKHEVRDGVKQTTILRLAVVEVMAEALSQAA